MEFARPLLELAGLIISLALVGLVLARSQETATVVTSSADALTQLINAASMGAGQGISTMGSYRRR